MANEFVTIGSYPNAAEAEVYRAALDAEGIKSYLADAGLVTSVWVLGNAVGYVKLQVAAGDVERAQVVLQTTLGEWPIDAEEEAAAGEDYESEEPTANTDAGDDEARRAWRAAIFGVMKCPPLLNLYSVYLLVNLGRSDHHLSPRGRRHVGYALVVNLMILTLVLVAALNLLRLGAS